MIQGCHESYDNSFGHQKCEQMLETLLEYTIPNSTEYTRLEECVGRLSAFRTVADETMKGIDSFQTLIELQSRIKNGSVCGSQ